jgi:hypothetical protein
MVVDEEAGLRSNDVSASLMLTDGRGVRVFDADRIGSAWLSGGDEIFCG